MDRALRYKCIGYGCMVFLLYILQTAADTPFRVLGHTPNFLLLLTIAVSFRESETFSGFFGLICGFLADAVTGSAVGLKAVFYMFLGYLLAVALQTLFRPLFLSYVYICIGALCISVLLEYLFHLVLEGHLSFIDALLHTMLPQIFLGGIWCYFIYYFVYRYNLALKRGGII